MMTSEALEVFVAHVLVLALRVKIFASRENVHFRSISYLRS